MVEPYYEGTLIPDICAAMEDTPIRVKGIGVPHEVLSHYGTSQQHDEAIGLTEQGIRQRITQFLNGSE